MAENLKRLDNSDLAKLQALEKQFGCSIVALEPSPKPASLSPAQLAQLQSAEKTMNAVLIAYQR